VHALVGSAALPALTGWLGISKVANDSAYVCAIVSTFPTRVSLVADSIVAVLHNSIQVRQL